MTYRPEPEFGLVEHYTKRISELENRLAEEKAQCVLFHANWMAAESALAAMKESAERDAKRYQALRHRNLYISLTDPGQLLFVNTPEALDTVTDAAIAAGGEG